MKQGTVLVPLAIAVIAGLASCASSEPRPDQQDAEASITQVDAGLVPPDDGLGEMPGWHMEWVVQAGGALAIDVGGDVAWDVVADDDGFVYLTGRFYSEEATVGKGTPSEIVINPYEVGCIFAASYASNGAPRWVNTIRADLYEGFDIALNEQGPVVSGRLEQGPSTFGSGEPNETTVAPACSNCPFVAQYTNGGAFSWALVPEASEHSIASINDVAVNSENSIYAVGNWATGVFSFGDGIDLDPSADGEIDGFLLSINAQGDVQWLRRFKGPGATIVDAVAAMADGGCVVLCHYQNEATFETSGGEFLPVSGESNYRAELVRYDRNGAVLWHKDIGVDGKNISSDGNSGQAKVPGRASSNLRVVDDRILATGYFSGAISSHGKQIVTLGKNTGGFLAMFNDQGGTKWVATSVSMPDKKETASYFSDAERLPNGTWLTIGTSYGMTRLATGQTEEIQLDAGTHHDGLFAGWSDDGKLLWWRELSGKNEPYNLTDVEIVVSSVARSGNALYVTGGFTGAVRFGARSSDSKVLTSWGSLDIFLMKLVPIDNPR